MSPISFTVRRVDGTLETVFILEPSTPPNYLLHQGSNGSRTVRVRLCESSVELKTQGQNLSLGVYFIRREEFIFHIVPTGLGVKILAPRICDGIQRGFAEVGVLNDKDALALVIKRLAH